MVYYSSILVAAALLARVTGSDAKQIPHLKAKSATAFRSPSPNILSSNVLELKKSTGSLSAKHLNAVRRGSYEVGISNLTSLFEGQEFSTPVTFSTETFNLIVDTGSSDTWLVQTGFDW
jgi:hypothetical protein